MTLIRKILRCDGAEEDLLGPTSLHDIRIILNAECLETLDLRDGNHIMLIDDDGQNTKPINKKATILYRSLCEPITTLHSIVGDVVIVPGYDFSEFN